MLHQVSYLEPDELDQTIFEALVPTDHYLRRVLAILSFDGCSTSLSGCYSLDQGRPAKEPLLMLKLCFLQFQYNLSDREVIAQAQVNIAFRLFLGLSLKSSLPDPSLLSRFRTRLGPDKYTKIFDDILSQARAHGLVKDRLRLKDATHVIADVAVPATLGLVAQVRDRLLDALEPFDQAAAATQRAEAQSIRTASADSKDEQRLLLRVNHLRVIVALVAALLAKLGPALAEGEPKRLRLQQAYDCAVKLLGDQADPDKGDNLGSAVDPDARWGKHGDYFFGYKVDITEDADSELITRVDVLPGNGDEGANAAPLIQAEEQAHGNDVESMSIDGAGFRGDVLRELQDPQGLNLEVIVPPTAEPEPTGRFTPERFSLEVINEQEVLECPAGQTTSERERNANDTGYKYRFKGKQCGDCPMREQCVAPKAKGPRTVVKNDYEKEYQKAREYAKTGKYREVRSEHARVERKLGEMVRRHGGRRARYRGRGRVRIQFLMTAVVVNIKRMVKLLAAPVRAELAPVG